MSIYKPCKESEAKYCVVFDYDRENNYFLGHEYFETKEGAKSRMVIYDDCRIFEKVFDPNVKGFIWKGVKL